MRSRARLLGVGLFVSLLTACGPSEAQRLESAAAARAEGKVLHQMIDAFRSLTQVWDRRVALTIVEDPSRVDELGEAVFWIHDKVGACVRYEVASVRGRARTRFELLCQRGHAEVTFLMDAERRFHGLDFGVRGVKASPEVRRAGEAFARSLTVEACRLGDDLLVGRFGARTLLICQDQDDRILTLRLSESGELVSTHLGPAATNG